MSFSAILGFGSENLKSSQKPNGSSLCATHFVTENFLERHCQLGPHFPGQVVGSMDGSWLPSVWGRNFYCSLPKPCLSFLKVRIMQLCYLFLPTPVFRRLRFKIFILLDCAIPFLVLLLFNHIHTFHYFFSQPFLLPFHSWRKVSLNIPGQKC